MVADSLSIGHEDKFVERLILSCRVFNGRGVYRIFFDIVRLIVRSLLYTVRQFQLRCIMTRIHRIPSTICCRYLYEVKAIFFSWRSIQYGSFV